MEWPRHVAQQARKFCSQANRELEEEPWRTLTAHLRQGLEYTTFRKLDENQMNDTLVQSVVCGMVMLQIARRRFDDAMLSRVLRHCGPFAQSLFAECDKLLREDSHVSDPLNELRETLSQSAPNCDAQDTTEYDGETLHFYEEFLKSYDSEARQRHGVYYTPAVVARNIVAHTDRLLREEFGAADGLADVSTWRDLEQRNPPLRCPTGKYRDSPFVHILDPAAGTGIFLTEVIDRIHQTVSTAGRNAGRSEPEIVDHWNRYVSRYLLPRLVGFELLLPAALLATLQIALKLADTGYVFKSNARIAVYVTDTLAGPDAETSARRNDCPWGDELHQLRRTVYDRPVTVILGNPPFSGISDNRTPWINDLLRGRKTGGEETSGYYQVDGKPLGERKVWLQDDYVKFFRYAHWQIERAGCGLIGFVTNHGYLDNASFRGMRQQLIESFPQITIMDLHGNRKKREITPAGELDESVFAIEQGVAISLFRKRPDTSSGEIRHRDIWGTRAEKTQSLKETDSARSGRLLSPQSPHYLLAPRDRGKCDAYDRATGLLEAMPVNSTAAVTARDGFVVDFDEQSLLEKMRLFRDLNIPSDEIRRRFFTNGRSRKYPPGDTRGWKLDAARQRMAADARWDQYTRTCLYRPFDWRVIYWADWMVDWPRMDVMQYMTRTQNLALITRRQMLPHQPCNFFWITDTIVLDGVIRSDNRGSESLFPLYLPEATQTEGSHTTRCVNFAPTFLEEVERATGLSWNPSAPTSVGTSFGPVDLLAYIYALFHAPTYRVRYADWLRVEFPRVLLPNETQLFRRLSQLGQCLIAQHTRIRQEVDNGAYSRETPCDAAENFRPPAWTTNEPSNTLGKGCPRHRETQIQLNDQCALDGVPLATWEYQIGKHQVCRKWLRDRRGRPLNRRDLERYRQIVEAIQHTQRCILSIDRQIAGHGAWPGAFSARTPR